MFTGWQGFSCERCIQRFVRSVEPEVRTQAKNGSPRSALGASGQRISVLRARAYLLAARTRAGNKYFSTTISQLIS